MTENFEGSTCTMTLEAQTNTDSIVTALGGYTSSTIAPPETFADGAEIYWYLYTGGLTLTFSAPTGSTIYSIALTVVNPTSNLTTSWTGNVCTINYDTYHSGSSPELKFTVTLTTGGNSSVSKIILMPQRPPMTCVGLEATTM